MEFMRDADGKVFEIFAFAGDRRENVSPTGHAKDVITTIEDAIRSDYGDRSADIAFHLSDWSSDAAFIVALHLFPERFTPEEIREGVEAIIIHAPNHLAAAAELGGYPVNDIFELGIRVPPDADEN